VSISPQSNRARLVGHKKPRIEYRVVDEYQSEFVFEPHSSIQPLRLGQLVNFLDNIEQSGFDLDIDAAWLRYGWILLWNEGNRACSDRADSVPYRDFTSISSEFCPCFGHDVFNLTIGHRGQARQNVAQISVGPRHRGAGKLSRAGH
jgi:hypothetical protein